jgi:ABC-type multidrug transport system fused ATPase/permease subunit
LNGILCEHYSPHLPSQIQIPIRDLNVNWLRQNISLVQQEPILFATTIEENLRMGKAEATMDEMVEACRMANAHDFIAKLPEAR